MLKISLITSTSKGAMFGLDARITVVVLSFLSIIAGIILYNTIDRASSTAYLNELRAIETAYKNFKYDTGYKLTTNANPYYYNIKELITLTKDSSKPYTLKFNGPYINYITSNDSKFITHTKQNYNVAIVSRSLEQAWTTATQDQKCSSTDCYKWIVLKNIDPTTAYNLDQTVDNNISENSGIIRMLDNGSNKDIYFKLEKE